MKIKIVSDLHLEFSDVHIQNNGCDVLILAGDIMVAQPLRDHPVVDASAPKLGKNQKAAVRFRDFLRRVSSEFPRVVYVAGNHEFYHGKWEQTVAILKEECAKYPNISYLERDSVVIDDVVFVGGTLWTDVNKGDPIAMYSLPAVLNDYKVIRNETRGYARVRPIDTSARHRHTLKAISTELERSPEQRVVVVTHHAPSRRSIKECYVDDHVGNAGYASDLDQFIIDHPQIVLWAHGHIHAPRDYVIGTTRVVSNPRGYEGYEDPTGWDPTAAVEI